MVRMLVRMLFEQSYTPNIEDINEGTSSDLIPNYFLLEGMVFDI